MDLLPYFSTEDQWVEVERRHSSYCVVVILRERDGLKRGFFKFKERTDGPIAANERLAYEFGTLLELPVAEMQYLTWDGMEGVISHRIAGRDPTEWRFLPAQARSNPSNTFANGAAIPNIGVFDTWICNHDRHEDNLMFSKNDNGDYMVFMIDHGLGFLGQTGKFSQSSWNDPEWLEVDRFVRLSEIRSAMQLGAQIDFVGKIKGIQSAAIVDAVSRQPENYITDAEKKRTISLILDRQSKIDEMLRGWLKKIGKSQ